MMYAIFGYFPPRMPGGEPGEQVAPKPRITPSADVDDVMREQLDSPINRDHSDFCKCTECRRYQRVREILLEPFGKSRKVA